MAIIKQLDPHVADLIAAGEVVERPLSVVKELVENALDADAGAITVEIQGGGLTYIRVTDDGVGMEEADAKLSFTRHATSKLEVGRDLEAISTLGFRGEALAAISAVSRIDLLTRQQNAPAGVNVTVEAGQVTSVAPVGCPAGTTMIVRDLFFNTPARLKFMKSDRAEAAAITAMLTSIALSHPAVSFRYIRDGKEEYHTPGDGNVQSAVYTLLGRDFAKGLIEVKSQDEGVRVSGFVSAPAHARGNRSQQHFYVNGRYVRSKHLQAALEQAYKNALFTGKFPGCVLYLTLPYGAVDVNVHPTKTEVKFLHEKQVFDAVYYGVLDALEQSSYMPEITLSHGTEKALGETKNPVGAHSVRPQVTTTDAHPGIPQITDTPVGAGSARPHIAATGESVMPSAKGADAQCAPLRVQAQPSMPGELRDEPAILYQSSLNLPETPVGANCVRPHVTTTDVSVGSDAHTIPCGDIAPSTPLTETPPADPGAQCAPLQGDTDIPPFRIVGEALGTYILVEQEDTLLFIDKHAAHERILFDQLRAETYTPMAQTLLTPVIVDLGPEVTATLVDYADVLAEFGFELDQFGMGTVALRQVPAYIDLDNMESFLAEIAAGLRLGKSPDVSAVRDEVLHTMACKAAIKAGRRSDRTEHEALAKRVLTGDVKYCPHGRPVSLSLSRGQLDKQVRRS